jgi:hypothetical protein
MLLGEQRVSNCEQGSILVKADATEGEPILKLRYKGKDNGI